MAFGCSENEGRLKGKKAPLVLMFAYFLLSIIMIRYFFSLVFIVAPDGFSWKNMIVNFFVVGYTIVMTILTVDAMLGLASARIGSWRRAVRSSVILVITNVLYELIEYFGFTVRSLVFSNLFVFGIMVIMLIIMFLPHVRRYYTPPMCEVPPIRKWIAFAIASPLVGAESYEFTYDGDAPETGAQSPADAEQGC